MSEIASPASDLPRAARDPAPLIAGGAGLLILFAGLLLWWREGEKLFTDGIIAAIAGCF